MTICSRCRKTDSVMISMVGGVGGVKYSQVSKTQGEKQNSRFLHVPLSLAG